MNKKMKCNLITIGGITTSIYMLYLICIEYYNLLIYNTFPKFIIHYMVLCSISIIIVCAINIYYYEIKPEVISDD